MTKTILITGATDGIGLLAAQKLSVQGHKVLMHGRSQAKLESAIASLDGVTDGFLADLSDLDQVRAMYQDVVAKHDTLDVLINNAGVLKAPNPVLDNGQDIRFVVNTLAPAILTKALLPIVPSDGRVLNLSSAAQAPVDITFMAHGGRADHMSAYAQSKLAITIWSQEMARAHPAGPAFIAVNPGSLLASKMVKEGFGIAGNDLNIGADILVDLSLNDGVGERSGDYFDNDHGDWGTPHAAASDPSHCAFVMQMIADLIA